MNYYQVLGVSRTATKEMIEYAYKNLISKETDWVKRANLSIAHETLTKDRPTYDCLLLVGQDPKLVEIIDTPSKTKPQMIQVSNIKEEFQEEKVCEKVQHNQQSSLACNIAIGALCGFLCPLLLIAGSVIFSCF